MRALLLLAALGASGCAVSRGAVPVEAPVVAIGEFTVDFAGVFGLHSSSSAFHVEHLRPQLLDRVRVERGLLSPDAPTDGPDDLELWTQRLLVSRLTTSGTLVSQVDGEAPVQASSALRDVRFVSGHDRFPVVVTNDSGDWRVAFRRGPESPSICPEELEFDLGYVHFEGNVVALPGGEVVAFLHEVALLTGPAQASVSLSLPDPATDPGPFCALLPGAFAASKALARQDTQYELAAEIVLSAALEPFGPVDPEL